MNTTRPFANFEFMLALRYLRARRKEGFISVISLFSFLGIMLGVATLIVVMSVFNGFHQELLSKILGFSGHATVFKSDQTPIQNYAETVAKIQSVDGVTKVIALIESQVLAASDAQKTGALVRGIRAVDLAKLSSIRNKDLQTALGNPPNIDEKPMLDNFDTAGGIAVGEVFARKHQVTLGSQIELLTPNGAETPLGQMPGSRIYPILTIFKAGMNDYDENVIYMPFDEAKDFFGFTGATSIELDVDDPEQIDRHTSAILEAAGSDMLVQTWKARNIAFFNALAVERNVVTMVLSLVVMVAALNIISGLYMLVKDKGSNIAILRTMGASQGSIMRVFFMTGSAIGAVGTLAGTLVGMLICWNADNIRQAIQWISGVDPFNPEFYYLAQLPAKIDYTQVFFIVLFALLISLLATIYPSWKAARLDPVEALRYE